MLRDPEKTFIEMPVIIYKSLLHVRAENAQISMRSSPVCFSDDENKNNLQITRPWNVAKDNVCSHKVFTLVNFLRKLYIILRSQCVTILTSQDVSRHTRKGTMVFRKWFFKCACAIPYLGYRHAFLPEASLRSLLNVCEQQRLWRDCAYEP